jgi:hypothetical protein
VGGKKMNFEKCFCFDGENMPNSERYDTAHKSKFIGDVSFIKKYNYPQKILMWVASHIKSRNAHTLFSPI